MPERGSDPRRTFLLLSLAVLVADQWTKWWVEANLQLHRPMEIIPGVLNFTHVENRGVAFGLFSNLNPSVGPILLIVLGLAALAIVAVYYTRIDPSQTLVLAALALVLGGAVGNLTDRILSGSVTDFIDAYYRGYHWHTFNIADSAITIGVLLILFDSFRPQKESTETAEAGDGEAGAVSDDSGSTGAGDGRGLEPGPERETGAL